MAELSYTDVQRAVSESIRNLQQNVQKLTSNVTVTNRAERIGTMEYLLRDLQRSMQLMQANITAMRQTNNADPRVTQIIHDLYELKVRFVAIERFAQQMGAYLAAKIEQENDEKAFRSAE